MTSKQTCISDYFKVKRSADREDLIGDKKLKVEETDSPDKCIIIDDNVNNILEIVLSDTDEDSRKFKQSKTILPATKAINKSTQRDNALNKEKKKVQDSKRYASAKIVQKVKDTPNVSKSLRHGDNNNVHKMSMEEAGPSNYTVKTTPGKCSSKNNINNVNDHSMKSSSEYSVKIPLSILSKLPKTSSDNALDEFIVIDDDDHLHDDSSTDSISSKATVINKNNSMIMDQEIKKQKSLEPEIIDEFKSEIECLELEPFCFQQLTPESSPQSSPKTPSKKSPEQFKNVHFDDIKYQTIQNLNSVIQGSIPPNDFNLIEVYSRPTFEYTYSKNIQKSILKKYDADDIKSHSDFNSYVLLTAIFTVLANPVNCGYFDEDELDLIYQILTLSEDSLLLLARLMKRKKGWFKGNDIDYPRIKDKEQAMRTLIEKKICIANTQSLFEALDMLDAKMIQTLCQKRKLKLHGNKKQNMQELLKFSDQKSLFPGLKATPGDVLLQEVVTKLGLCIKISEKTWNVIESILILLMPIYDSNLDIKDRIHELCNIHSKRTVYPKNPGNYFPVFANKWHLKRYIEETCQLFNVMKSIEMKNWTQVQKYGVSAMNNLSEILNHDQERLRGNDLPAHVQRLMPGYKRLKILDKCVQAFKKSDDKQAEEALWSLIDQQCYMHDRKGQWYTELCIIYTKKNIEETAGLIMIAFNEELTVTNKIDLWERGDRIRSRKTGGVSESKKNDLTTILTREQDCIPIQSFSTHEITARLMPPDRRGKSTWCLERDSENASFGSVEQVAIRHYASEGFKGKHVEGSLPMILFFTLFWEELYNIDIPGAFITPYQEMPNDLFTGDFYENRRNEIYMKIIEINEQFDDDKFSKHMKEHFEKYRECISGISIPFNKITTREMEEIVHCLGKIGVIRICKRLCENYKLWRAGFPDLFLWNHETKEHKIVEVKGPKDRLSTKQRLWLDFLHGSGLNVEVCLVKSVY